MVSHCLGGKDPGFGQSFLVFSDILLMTVIFMLVHGEEIRTYFGYFILDVTNLSLEKNFSSF